ncbi:MAG: chemotaxis protein CheX [Pirellulaceae bacterium]|nr:chemotaxis protein CheX [Pirellulaceae bacterium]
MRVEWINPFVTATCDVFRKTLACELTRCPMTRRDSFCPSHEVSGLIGLTGQAQGMVVVSLGRQTAIRVAEIMLETPQETINADVADAVGEIANMIAGSAKSRLAEYELSVGLPTVICGKNHVIAFPSKSTPVLIPFESNIGPFCLEVSLVEQAAGNPRC